MISPTYRADIDGLRAIAVISVVLFHAFPNQIPGGFVGVDIFFVISGYLITTIISQSIFLDKFSFAEFYVRRIKRIFPALLVIFIVFYTIGWFFLVQDDYAYFGKHLAGSSVFLSNILLLNESGYFDSAANSKPLLHLWSLAIEEQFYIFWPFLLWFIIKKKINYGAILFALFLISFVINIYLVNHDDASAYYFPLGRFWELFLGGLIAIMVLQKNSFIDKYVGNYKDSLSVIGLLTILIGFFLISGGSKFPGFLALLPVFGTAIIILSSGDAWLNKVILSNRILVWFGLISFSLYLWHWPIFTFWNLIAVKQPSVFVYWMLIFLSILLAWLTYSIIENPIRKNSGNKIAVFLVIGLFLLGFLGFNAYQRNGLSFRKINKVALQSDIDKYLSPPSSAIDCSIGFSDQNNRHAYNEACIKRSGNEPSSSVYIWGDSHVANLSYGLTKERLNDFNLNLLISMMGACPPIIGYEPSQNNKCKAQNEYSFQVIQDYKPNTVILVGYWALYFNPRRAPALTELDIINTVQKLKTIGVRKIILVGSFPSFDFSLARLGRNLFKPNAVNRTYESFISSTNGADSVIAKIAKQYNVEYISPLNLLCNQEGCLLSANESELIPMAYDGSHFTYPGANLFVRDFLGKQFFQ